MLDAIKNVDIILINRLRGMFHAGFRKLGLSAEVQEIVPELWGMSETEKA